MEHERTPLRILVFSDHGSVRGPLAAAALRAAAGEGARVVLAAVDPGDVAPGASAAMRAQGWAPVEPARSIGAIAAESFDLVLTVGATARERLGATCEDLRPRESPEAMAERCVLLVGLPLHLHWALEAGEGGSGATAAAASRLAAAIRGRVESLVEDGWLAGLASERARFDRLADALGDGLVVHDAARRIFVFNRAAERITGYARDDVVGRDCHRVFAPDGLCGAACPFDRPDAGIPDRAERSLVFTRPDGETRRLKVTAARLDPGPRSAGGVLAVIRDVTEVDELRFRLRTRQSFHGMVGVSGKMRDVFERVRQAAASDYAVLIAGESGTGKELVANAIHNESRRRAGPFVPVNCGALPETIIESELFGHVRGAFTGAVRDKKGRFELAHGGTLFLDEIAEITPALQVKLLRVLQEKRFERVGGERPVDADVRIVSATNRDLRRRVRQGLFREDLFYRLCVVPIDLPPLRDRREDIPFLVEKILEDIRAESGKPIRTVADPALDALTDHAWPGNVRELINVLQYASVRCDGDTLHPRHLPPEVRAPRAAALDPLPLEPPAAGGRRVALDAERVRRALEETGGNKIRAARRLGVSRATLYRFLGRGETS